MSSIAKLSQPMLNFRPGCSSVGSDRLQMDSNLHRMFRPWPMPSYSWRVPTSSTDRLGDAISYLPLVNATWHPGEMCTIVSLLPYSLQFGSSTRPHWCWFTEDGSLSYTDLSRNEIRNWSFLHSSAHVSSRSGRSNFIQVHCFPSSDDLAFLWSSSVPHTSA